MAGRVEYCGVLRVVGLNDDPAGINATARSPCHLCQQLKGPFSGPEIRQAQKGIGGDDAGQGDVGEVVSLGDHLGSDQDLDPPVGEGAQSVFESGSTADSVTVEDG